MPVVYGQQRRRLNNEGSQMGPESQGQMRTPANERAAANRRYRERVHGGGDRAPMTPASGRAITRPLADRYSAGNAAGNAPAGSSRPPTGAAVPPTTQAVQDEVAKFLQGAQPGGYAGAEPDRMGVQSGGMPPRSGWQGQAPSGGYQTQGPVGMSTVSQAAPPDMSYAGMGPASVSRGTMQDGLVERPGLANAGAPAGGGGAIPPGDLQQGLEQWFLDQLGGPRDTSEEEAQLLADMEAAASAGILANRARLGAAGMGTSGAMGMLDADARSGAMSDYYSQVFDLREQARQEELDRVKAALGGYTGMAGVDLGQGRLGLDERDIAMREKAFAQIQQILEDEFANQSDWTMPATLPNMVAGDGGLGDMLRGFYEAVGLGFLGTPELQGPGETENGSITMTAPQGAEATGRSFEHNGQMYDQYATTVNGLTQFWLVPQEG